MCVHVCVCVHMYMLRTVSTDRSLHFINTSIIIIIIRQEGMGGGGGVRKRGEERKERESEPERGRCEGVEEMELL